MYQTFTLKKSIIMSSAVERLIQFIDIKGDTKYKFTKKTGLSNGFLDKSRNIGSDKCHIISEVYPDLNLTWLITGKGSMFNDLSESNYNQTISGNNNNQIVGGYFSDNSFIVEEMKKLKKENEKLKKQIDKLINKL